jgi:sugar phosphate isomerase/epimerase
MKWTIGCTTRPYSNVSFAGACAHIAAAGYTDVALFGNTGVTSESSRETVLAARQTAGDAGLNPSMVLAHARLELGIKGAAADYRRLIDNAALLGARWLLDLGTSQADKPRPNERRGEYLAVMRQVAPYAKEAGIGISLKPHGGITLTTADLIAIHAEVDHPAFGICYDPGNLIYYTKGKERPEMHVAEVAPLVTTGIIKDCVLRDGKPDVMITPGEGLVDFPAVLSALVRGGFGGPLYVECVGGEALDEIDANLRRTLSFVRGALT